MKRWQKVLLTLLGVFVLLIAGLSAYGIRFMGEASQTVNKISKNSNRISSKRSE
ncbi:LytR family transcriptional regulator, partial [Enterococcus faecalis]